MRIVTWNANCKFRDKFHLLGDFDLAIVQECEDPKQSNNHKYIEWASDYFWTGNLKHKGLGIFLGRKHYARLIDVPTSAQSYFLPIELANGVQVIGVWAMGSEKRQEGYVAQIHDYIDANAQYFNWNKLIIIGDFNSNAQWDGKRELKNHSNLVTKLSNYGLTSLYHSNHNLQHGKEKSPTFCMYRDQKKPYHIDYIFMPSEIISKSEINIGEPAEWLKYSDHVPISSNVLSY